MNGAWLRLPKHNSDLATNGGGGDGGAPVANGIKRLWWKYSNSAQRTSPPPRLLLVVLLSAQILFLAMVRFGPSASVWSFGATVSSETSPASVLSSSILVGNAVSTFPHESTTSSNANDEEIPSLELQSNDKAVSNNEEKKKTEMESNDSSSSSELDDVPKIDTLPSSKDTNRDDEEEDTVSLNLVSKSQSTASSAEETEEKTLAKIEDSISEDQTLTLVEEKKPQLAKKKAPSRRRQRRSSRKRRRSNKTEKQIVKDENRSNVAVVADQNESEQSKQIDETPTITSDFLSSEQDKFFTYASRSEATTAEASESNNEQKIEQEGQTWTELKEKPSSGQEYQTSSSETKSDGSWVAQEENKASGVQTQSEAWSETKKQAETANQEQSWSTEQENKAATESQSGSEIVKQEGGESWSQENKEAESVKQEGGESWALENKEAETVKQEGGESWSKENKEAESVKQEGGKPWTQDNKEAETAKQEGGESWTQENKEMETVKQEGGETWLQEKKETETGNQGENWTASNENKAESQTEEVKQNDSVPKEEPKNPTEQASETVNWVEDNAKNADQGLIAQTVTEGSASSQCAYGYIYVYELPPVFNRDIISNCTALNPWQDVCPTLANGGLGESLGDASPLGQVGSWFVTDQFTAEVVFHNRMLQHPCLTDKPELASGFYIPFYAGLDVGRFLWSGFTSERRDRVSKQLLEWLDGQPAWKKSGGWDHFFMVGRITWDFRRSRDEDWGSGFFYNPGMQNVTRLLIERNPWDDKEMAVPYPTNFHPQSDADLVAWQNHVRSVQRNTLFSFAGAPRKRFADDFRAILFDQCQQAESCRSLDCSDRTCEDNQKTLELFKDSKFCLQPRGDSFTRRSTFDCLLAGSIPVFFWHRSAYLQYKWHLPVDESSYSIFIAKEDMRNGTKIEQVLKSFPPEKVQSMQENVIQMIPKIVYAASGFSLKENKDAFDVAVEGVLKRFKEHSNQF